jgi:hypothetical protein
LFVAYAFVPTHLPLPAPLPTIPISNPIATELDFPCLPFYIGPPNISPNSGNFSSTP